MKCRNLAFIALLAGSVFLSQRSFCWGKEGHQMVGKIAYTHMNNISRAAVTKYLAGMTVEDAATWMDDVRSEPQYANQAPWHYINIDKGQQYAARPGEANIINEISKAMANLKNRARLSDDEIKFNVKVLFHLVGDLHQPLHTGYGGDKGGNKVAVAYNGNTTNLHALWDGGIIKAKQVTYSTCEALYNTYTPTQVAAIKKIDAAAWLNQSRNYLPQVYDFKNGNITDDYVTRGKSVVEKQVLSAGLRLAAIMDEVFKK